MWRPGRRSAVDWDATLAFRRHLWGLGFKIAEAMDTSQRGMGLDWPTARELIRRSLAEARTIAGRRPRLRRRHRPAGARRARRWTTCARAYEEQLEAVEAAGGRAILMASRALARRARSADDYLAVYGGLIRQARQPVILHWLGDMFDPQLAGYWGSSDVDAATETVLTLIREHAAKVDGIKISLLEEEREVALRRRLPAGVQMFTGDDFNYARADRGRRRSATATRCSASSTRSRPPPRRRCRPWAPATATRFRAVLAPTVPLSRKIFEAPTQYYKAGVVFLAWLNGHQDHFAMVGGMQSARSALHYADVFRLADRAALLRDPELAAARMTPADGAARHRLTLRRARAGPWGRRAAPGTAAPAPARPRPRARSCRPARSRDRRRPGRGRSRSRCSGRPCSRSRRCSSQPTRSPSR